MKWWEELDVILKDHVPDRQREEKHKKQVKENWKNKKQKYYDNRRKAREEEKRTFG